jgi:hypothetical protein
MPKPERTADTWARRRACLGKTKFPSKRNATARARVIGDGLVAYSADAVTDGTSGIRAAFG